MSDYITVATFHSMDKAEPLTARLNQAGIKAETDDESNLQRFLFFSSPRAAFKVRVHQGDFKPATDLLHQWDLQEGIMRQAVRCPECASSRVQYPQYTRKFFTPALVAMVRALVGAQRKYYCQACQKTWTEVVPVAKPLTRHHA